MRTSQGMAFLVITALGITVAAVVGKPHAVPKPLSIGDDAPHFSLPVIAGLGQEKASSGNRSLASRRGAVTVVAFWSTWCAHCDSRHYDLERLHEEFTGEGVDVWSVLYRDSEENLQRWMRRREVPTYAVLKDRGIAAMEYQVTGVPQIIVVGKDLTIRYRCIGCGGVEVRNEIVEAIRAELNRPI